MKVLLTGACGSIGAETLKQLIKNNHEVSVLELDNKSNRRNLKKYNNLIKITYGSINDKKLVNKLVKEVEAIIHLAAVIPPLADSLPDLAREVNYFGTCNIVNAIKKYNPNIFLIYTSSVSVYGDRLDDYYIKVGDKLNPSIGDYYALTKIEAESMIIKSKINYTIIRLTGIMGRPDLDPLMFHMPLDTKMEIASTLDTALALNNALSNLNKLNKRIFNLGGGDKCRTTYRDFLINMFKIYGINIKYFKDVLFAEQNFHCGYFLDSHKLDSILHFQNDTLDSYYKRVEKDTKGVVRFFSKLFSRPIIYFLSRKSDPLKAMKKHDNNLITRFFKKK